MTKVLIAGGGLAGLAAAAALAAPDSKSTCSKRARFWAAAPRPIPCRRRRRIRDHRQLPAHPAALLRQPARLLRAAGRSRTHPLLPRVRLPGAGGRASILRRAAAGAIPLRRRIPEDEMSGRGRQAGHRARALGDSPRAYPAAGSGQDQHERLAAAKAANAAPPSTASGARCWSARSTKIWTAWPPARLSGALAGFLARADAYEMGVPAVPLAELYGAGAWQRLPAVRTHFRAPVEAIDAAASWWRASGAPPISTISALPFERLPGGRPPAPHSSIRPITGVHFGSIANHHPAARRAARPHHAMDVQQGSRTLPETGGKRFARSEPICPREDVIDIAVGDLRLSSPACAKPPSCGAHVVKSSAPLFPPRPAPRPLRPPRKPLSRTYSSGRLDPQPGWPPPWKARCAAATSARRRVTARRRPAAGFLLARYRVALVPPPGAGCRA